MSVEYYYVGDDQKAYGPLPLEHLKQLHAAGTLRDDTLIAQAGTQSWTPYASHPAVTGQLPPTMGAVTPPVPSPAPTASPRRSETNATGKVAIGVGIGCLLLVLLAGGGCAAFFYGIFSMLNDEPRKEAIVQATAATLKENHPAALAELGPPLRPGYMYSGNIHWGATTTFNGVLPVDGAKNSGVLHFDAQQAGSGPWQFNAAQLELNGRTINLLEPAAEGDAETEPMAEFSEGRSAEGAYSPAVNR
ncbi:MAG: cytochrome c oxidase assembly factor Coa1 family protein [Verrucomicrobiota bacterium]